MSKREEERRGNHWRQRNNIYYALEEVDLTWSMGEVFDLAEMWEAGISLADMSAKLKRDPDEVALLLFDRAMKGKIQRRPGGVYGYIPGSRHADRIGAGLDEIIAGVFSYAPGPQNAFRGQI